MQLRGTGIKRRARKSLLSLVPLFMLAVHVKFLGVGSLNLSECRAGPMLRALQGLFNQQIDLHAHYKLGDRLKTHCNDSLMLQSVLAGHWKTLLLCFGILNDGLQMHLLATRLACRSQQPTSARSLVLYLFKNTSEIPCGIFLLHEENMLSI